MSQPGSPQSGAGEPQSGTAGTPDANATSGTGETTQGGGTAGEGTTGTTPPEQTSTVKQEDYDRLRTQLSAADQARQKAQDELKQLKDKDLPALEKLNRDLGEATARIGKLEAELKDARIANAFLSSNKHEWHDPEAARKLADLSKIEIDQTDGTVRGMEDALTALAKSHPFLLKPKKGSEEEESGTVTPTTPPLNSSTPSGTGAASKDQLKKRFPAARSRLG